MTKTTLVIFDLDGTLLDSVEDLASAANYALQFHGFPIHPVDAYRFFIGGGVDQLLRRILPEGEHSPQNVERLRKSFLEFYGLHGTERTKPYPGIVEMLHEMKRRGLELAVASNKHQEGAVRITSHFFGDTLFRIVYGQREGAAPKPDPRIVLDILEVTGHRADTALYVGDSGVDMETASRSGVRSIGVTWGLRPRTELEAAGAGAIVDTPGQILSYLD